MEPRTGSSLAALAVFGVVLALGAQAAADETPDPSAGLAQTLFGEGRALLAEGRTEEACAKFTESFRLVPASGTLLNLGLCHEKVGKLATAYAELGASVSRAVAENRPEREKLAREHVVAIEQRVARIIVHVPAEVEVAGLEVKLDGAALGKAAWGARTPVDAGAHILEASAPRRVAFRTTIDVGTTDGEAHDVTVPPLAPGSGSTSFEGEPAGAPPASSPPPRMVWQTRRWIGFALVLGGLMFTQASIGFVIEAADDREKWRARCPTGTCANPADNEFKTDADTQTDYARVGFVLGGVALTSGVLLFLLSPNVPAKQAGLRVAPTASAGAAGLVAHGVF